MIEFFTSLHWDVLLNIIIIDILLGGDNAVIIALACRNLNEQQRIKGILWGTVGAISMRIVLIAFAIKLLDIEFIKIVGGILLIWIGVKLLIQEEDHNDIAAGTSVWTAIKTILIADFVMSLDNVLAIAAAADKTEGAHQIGYVAFGLIISVPIIIWGSSLVIRLIHKYPFTIILGAALLGWLAGGMIITDVFTQKQFFAGQSAPNTLIYGFEIGCALLVIIAGKLLQRSNSKAV